MNTKHLIRSFGRIKGRGITIDEQRLVEEELIEFAFDVDKLDKYCGKPLYLEIGFGFGEHIFEQALRNPDANFIGCEAHINGIASLIKKINSSVIDNINIFNGDARILLSEMQKQFLDKIFIICPDPWPKARHHKRRLINTEFLIILAEKLKNDGEIVIASDHSNYVECIKETIKVWTI